MGTCLNPERKQLVLDLYLINEKTQAEISRILNVSRNVVAGIIDRYRRTNLELSDLEIKNIDLLPDPPSFEQRIRGDLVNSKGCKFVLGELGTLNWEYCSKPFYRKSWCEEHYKLCFRVIEGKDTTNES